MNTGLIILRAASERRDAQNDETSIHFPPRVDLNLKGRGPRILGHSLAL